MKKLYNRVVSWQWMKRLTAIPFFARVLSYEIVMYLFFGVLTTVVNLVIFNLCGLIRALDAVLFTVGGVAVTWDWLSQFFAWCGSVIFAFFTNKYFVFESRERSAKGVFKELGTFVSGRILSFLIFEEGMYILLDRLLLSRYLSPNLSKNISKIIVAVFVVIFNFLVGKFVSFRKKENQEPVES